MHRKLTLGKLKLGMSIAILLSLQISPAFAIGAIAVHDSQGTSANEAGYGVGYGSSRHEAERNAIRRCENAGNDGCTIAVWYETCGAYAGDRVNFGIGYGSSKRDAEDMALDSCPHCKLIVSDCQ
jgi:hypothetical protein